MLKEVNSTLPLVRLNMKTLREGIDYGLKLGQNRGLSCPHAYLLLVPKQDYTVKDQEGG